MNLQEQTNRIKQMMGVVNEDISLSLRRRLPKIHEMLRKTLTMRNPCEYNNEDFFRVVLTTLKFHIYDIKSLEGLPHKEVENYIKEYLVDEINQFYIDNTKDCK